MSQGEEEIIIIGGGGGKPKTAAGVRLEALKASTPSDPYAVARAMIDEAEEQGLPIRFDRKGI